MEELGKNLLSFYKPIDEPGFSVSSKIDSPFSTVGKDTLHIQGAFRTKLTFTLTCPVDYSWHR